MNNLADVPAASTNAHNAFGDFGIGYESNGSEETAGTLLRNAREAAGVHIAALAVTLKVPVRKLEALEQDRFDLLPDAVFARALAASVCRTLKLDATMVLERLPRCSTPKLSYPATRSSTPFRSSSYGVAARTSLKAQLTRPAVLTGFAFLVGALILIFLPAKKMDANSGAPALDSVIVSGESLKSLPAAMSKAGSDLADSTKSALSALQTSDAVNPVTAAPTGGLVVTDSIAPPILEQTQAMVASAPAALAGDAAVPGAVTGIVTFRAKGQSWVEVTDAKGTVVLRRTLAAGELAGASGTLPLTAVVGRADATQVQVRGQVFELSAVTKDNVARFEVK